MSTIVINGNLTRDAEIRTTPNGDNVCSFSVAETHYKTKEAYYFECSYWGKRGSAVQPYLTKGNKVSVIGEFSWREYNGKKYLECNVYNLDFAGGKVQSEKTEPESYNQAPDPVPDLDDEIPF